MKTLIATLILLAAGCDTVTIGLKYPGRYGTYTVTRRYENGQRSWDIQIDANGKAIIPPDYQP